jgi:hypothetical protein
MVCSEDAFQPRLGVLGVPLITVPDKSRSAWNEVKRLLSAGVIREVKYPEWLANTVMVK